MSAEIKSTLVSFSINRFIAFLVAGGFFFLLIETRIEHDGVLGEKLAAYVPIAFSIIGFVVALLAALKWQEKYIRVLHLYLFFALAVGFGGMYFHNEDRLGEKEDTSSEMKDDDSKEGDKKAEEKTPPILAPFAFAGLGAVGLLGTYRRWKAEVV
ncbi:MAG: hypothetical protein HW374_1644 [Bacteroidetes bacterium]|nr:hypothetical protein [Bacteroidota bacterium]